MDAVNAKRNYNTHGTTIIELLLVMAIIGIFTRLITLNLFRGLQHTSLAVSRDTLISDIRKQQFRAMHGDIEDPGVYIDYSIRFEQDRYILFPGIVYDAENPDNDTILLDPILQFTAIDLPLSTITFARLSGDIREFNSTLHTITIANVQTDEQYRLNMNARGIPFVE